MLVGALLLSFDAAADGVDVRLVIDVSGSMKSGDQYLRGTCSTASVVYRPAVAPCLDIRRMAAVVVPGAVDDAWRRTARRSNADRQRRARAQSQRCVEECGLGHHRSVIRYQRHIVLVSDGQVDVADDAASNDAASRDYRRTGPRLRAGGIRVDCLVLSGESRSRVSEADRPGTQGHIARADTVAAVKEYLVTALGGIALPARSRSPPTRH
jgi:hypothetical protein